MTNIIAPLIVLVTTNMEPVTNMVPVRHERHYIVYDGTNHLVKELPGMVVPATPGMALPPVPPSRAKYRALTPPAPPPGPSVAAKSMPAPLIVQPTCAICPRAFNQFFDFDPIPEFGFPAFTNFVSQWDQLRSGWFYEWQYSASPKGPWTTGFQAVWTSTDTNAFFGWERTKNQTGCEFQRAVASEAPTNTAGFVALLSAKTLAPMPPQFIHRKGDKWIPFNKRPH